MKHLMKFFLVIVLFTMAASTFAQTFAVKGGLNLSTAVVKDNTDSYTDDFKMKPGFHLGATAEFPISDIFAFETGLMLSTKGIKEEYSESGYEATTVMNLYYFDIPLYGKAYYSLSSMKIYGLFGPYVGIGLSGKTKYKESGSSDQSETINWGTDSENDDLKRMDFGLTFGGGVEVSSFQVGLSYSLGLANVSPYTGDGFKINNRLLALSVAYRFAPK